jgi:hypothetical protein
LSLQAQEAVQQGALVAAVISLAVIIALIAFRKRLGALNTASWLVIWGAIIIAGEHPFFAILYSLGLLSSEGPMILLPHAQVHFFMAGIYTLVGLFLLSVIARTLLREGRRAGWYAVLFALAFGGGSDLIAGSFLYSHGLPIYEFFTGVMSQGFGWEYLYTYLVAWAAGLALSYKPIFAGRKAKHA